MRISDWSSDVCSSDLLPLTDELTHGARHFRFTLDLLDIKILGVLVGPVIGVHRLAERFRGLLPVAVMVAIAMRARLALTGDGIELRSEEHTSELHSLMSISYAFFCLKPQSPFLLPRAPTIFCILLNHTILYVTLF